MSKFTECRLGFLSGKPNEKSLKGKWFSSQQFEELSLGPIENSGQKYEIVDCNFINCKISPGEFVIRHGVFLQNVVFENVFCKECLTISSNAVLDRVTLKGIYKEGGLWIKPDEIIDKKQHNYLVDWVNFMSRDIETMLDISNYEAPDIAILGIPVSKVVINPEKHVVVYKKWKHEVDWDNLLIKPTSLWRIAIRYLQGFGVEEGIFSFPVAGDRKYIQTIEEYQRLKASGIIV